MPAPKVAAAKHPRAKPRTREFGIVRREDRPDRIIPQLPAKLGGVAPLKTTVEAWELLWSSGVASVLELDSDIESVVRWASLLDERARAFEAYRSCRIVEGGNGQPVLSPYWKVVQNCDAELRALEDRIGLSPQARLRLGITYADAATSLDGLNKLMERDADEDEAGTEADPRFIEATAT